jgi:hypothetical protein
MSVVVIDSSTSSEQTWATLKRGINTNVAPIISIGFSATFRP